MELWWRRAIPIGGFEGDSAMEKRRNMRLHGDPYPNGWISTAGIHRQKLCSISGKEISSISSGNP
jgi:hypothetical protein